MMRGMFAAISGLKTHQVMLDVTANDISNVNTIGYKSARATFKDALSQSQRGAAGPTATNAGANATQIGLGTSLGSIDNLMQGGAQQSTGNPLDLFIQGDGFFELAQGAPAAGGDPLTPKFYSRAGNLTVNSAGFLTSQEGLYVCGRPTGGTGSVAIKLPAGATDVAIDSSGGISYVDPTTRDRVSLPQQLELATFSNPAGLEREGGNRWMATANSGTARLDTPNTGAAGPVVPGMLEMSNVDLASTFTNMITAQRGFQANSRVISTSDEMLQDLVNLKR
jgi:flagellar hook protein FlgE